MIKIENYEPKRGPYLLKEIEVLIFLRYLATGSFMLVCSDLNLVSHSTAWRSIHRSIKRIASLSEEIIKMPQGNELQSVSTCFKQKRGFPGVVGCVDGTQIPLKVPMDDVSETFRNRKGFFSLNVQMVCGPGPRPLKW